MKIISALLLLFLGHSYLFRVSACNDFGTGQPLEADKATKIQAQYGKLGVRTICISFCWFKEIFHNYFFL